MLSIRRKGVGVYKEVIQSDGSAKAVFTKVSIYAKQGNSYYISASGLTTEDYLIGASVEKVRMAHLKQLQLIQQIAI